LKTLSLYPDNNNRGEITTALFVLSMVIITLGTFASTRLSRTGPKLNPYAASVTCESLTQYPNRKCDDVLTELNGKKCNSSLWGSWEFKCTNTACVNGNAVGVPYWCDGEKWHNMNNYGECTDKCKASVPPAAPTDCEQTNGTIVNYELRQDCDTVNFKPGHCIKIEQYCEDGKIKEKPGQDTNKTCGNNEDCKATQIPPDIAVKNAFLSGFINITNKPGKLIEKVAVAYKVDASTYSPVFEISLNSNDKERVIAYHFDKINNQPVKIGDEITLAVYVMLNGVTNPIGTKDYQIKVDKKNYQFDFEPIVIEEDKPISKEPPEEIEVAPSPQVETKLSGKIIITNNSTYTVKHVYLFSKRVGYVFDSEITNSTKSIDFTNSNQKRLNPRETHEINASVSFSGTTSTFSSAYQSITLQPGNNILNFDITINQPDLEKDKPESQEDTHLSGRIGIDNKSGKKIKEVNILAKPAGGAEFPIFQNSEKIPAYTVFISIQYQSTGSVSNSNIKMSAGNTYTMHANVVFDQEDKPFNSEDQTITLQTGENIQNFDFTINKDDTTSHNPERKPASMKGTIHIVNQNPDTPVHEAVIIMNKPNSRSSDDGGINSFEVDDSVDQANINLDYLTDYGEYFLSGNTYVYRVFLLDPRLNILASTDKTIITFTEVENIRNFDFTIPKIVQSEDQGTSGQIVVNTSYCPSQFKVIANQWLSRRGTDGKLEIIPLTAFQIYKLNEIVPICQ